LVALFVIALILLALTADYFVQRLARPLPALETAPVLEIPAGLYVHAFHTWLQPETEGLFRVGADGFAAWLLGTPESIELQAATGLVERGAPLAVLRSHGRSLTLRSPVAGMVVEQNTELTRSPGALAAEPFGAGWLVRLRPLQPTPQFEQVHTGESLRQWARQEMDRLRALVLSSQGASTVGVTAADGGPLAPWTVVRLDDITWAKAAAMLFGIHEDPPATCRSDDAQNVQGVPQ
jgi:glycine cleavage system H protein